MNKILVITFSIITFLTVFSVSTFASEVTGTLSGGFIGSRTVTNPNPTNMASEATAGLLSISGSTPSATTNFTFNVEYVLKDGTTVVTFPADTVVTKTGGGEIDLTQFGTTNNTVEIKSELGTTLGSVKIGIPNVNLTFSKSITVTIPVGSAYNGQTLTAYYRAEGSTEWIVETTCVVSSGNCTFQTTHATTFAARDNATSNYSSSSSSSSSNNSNSNSTCKAEKPSSTPDLFQIDTTDTTAQLFFTPLSNTSRFYMSFSTLETAEEHGADVTLAREGVQNFTVNLLNPNTIYYLKVRGQNGCMPGEWSNVMKIRTNQNGYTVKNMFYKNSPYVEAPIISTPIEVSEPVLGATDKIERVSPPIVQAQPTKQSPPLPKKKQCLLLWCW